MNDLLIMVPYWGTNAAYRGWLDRWLAAARAHAPGADLLVVSDDVLPADLAAPKLWVDTTPFAPLVDPSWPYDRKGAIVCAALAHQPHRPLLVLDADAFMVGDPRPLLARYADSLLAMPLDEGAFGAPFAAPLQGVIKRCAGVMLFGASGPGYRRALVEAWQAQFFRLRSLIDGGTLAEERRLLEQHAWSLVATHIGSSVLPRELNWPACFPSVGANPDAVIHHHIGKRKWQTAPAAPEQGLLNARQMETLGQRAFFSASASNSDVLGRMHDAVAEVLE